MLDKNEIRRHRLGNLLQSVVLVTIMSALMGYIALLLAGELFALLVIGMVVLVYWTTPTLALSLVVRLYRCRPISIGEAPALHQVLDMLSERAGLDKVPGLYYLPSRMANAFTLGARQDAVIVFSHGLLARLTLEELAGVMAHEVSHIANNDIKVMSFADITGRITRFLALVGCVLLLINLPFYVYATEVLPWWPILVLMFAPILADLSQLALSRVREFNADLGAAILLGTPTPLVAALIKLDDSGVTLFERWGLVPRTPKSPSVLRSHPETKKRIERLLSFSSRQRLFVHSPLTNIANRPSLLDAELFSRPDKPRWHRSGIWY